MRVKIAAAGSMLLAAVTLTACVPPGVACPAIGYVYDGPVMVESSPDLVGDGTLSACFGAECEAAAVAPDPAGHWEIPQEPPYAPANTISLAPGTSIRVVITTSAGDVTRDEWIEVPYTRQSVGSCPGPVDFHPVELR